MFSFLKNSFKKLFNFEKADTNSDEKDKQVELDDDGNTRFENVQIKDTDLNGRFNSNGNYQRAELTTYHSSFTSFQSNEIAATSSEINLCPNSFDDSINVYYKSQRKSSKLAAIKITKIADRLSMQSDEEMSDESDDVLETSSEQKVKSSQATKLMKNPCRKNLEQKTVRFCRKCKIHKIIIGNVTKRVYCNVCKNILFYLCSNCKEKLYASHKGWKVHEKICNGTSGILKLVNGQNENIVHQYSDYNLNYATKDEKKTKGLKALDKKALATNKLIKMKSLSKWIKRHCERCQKTAKLAGISKMRNNIKCKNCSTRLQFKCIKCHAKYKSNIDMSCHLQSKCSPINYKCSKCNFNTTNATSLNLHLKIQHPVIFQCDMCPYQSQIKSNLKRHIECIHCQERISCQMCSFTTPHLQNLRRHERISHSSE